MATQQVKRRIREAPDPSGMISRNKAAEKYKVPPSAISAWVKNGDVKIAKEAAFQGDTVLLDEASLRSRLQSYTPHKDNQSRRGRSRTVVEMRAESAKESPQSLPNYHVGGRVAGEVRNGGGVRPPAPKSVDTTYRIPAGVYRSEIPSGAPLRLDNKPWYQLYVDQNEAKWTERSKIGIRTFANRFLRSIPVLDLTDPLITRGALKNWLDNLPDEKRPGQTVSDGTKETYRKKANSFITWLNQNYGYPAVNLQNFGYKEGVGIPIEPWQTRLVLKQCQDATERDIVYLFAQTGMRISDLVTINPQLLHTTDNGLPYVEVFGKRTKANKIGYRQIPLPSECYQRLKRHLDSYGELVWIKNNGDRIPIGGQISQVDPRRPINLMEPRRTGRAPATFTCDAYSGSDQYIRDIVERLVKNAGVYQYGMGAHAWRHAYTDEWLRNGGRERYCHWMLGHLSSSDINNRYTHIPIADLCEEAERYAPRDFLREPAPQGELALAGD